MGNKCKVYRKLVESKQKVTLRTWIGNRKNDKTKK